MHIPTILLSFFPCSPPTARAAAAAAIDRANQSKGTATSISKGFSYFGPSSAMKQGIVSRLHPLDPPALTFEALYCLRRHISGSGPVSVISSSSALPAACEEWQPRVLEYALPDGWSPMHGDTLCTVFTDLNSRFTFLFAVYSRTVSKPDGQKVDDNDNDDKSGFVDCLALVTRRPGFDIFPALLRQLSTGAWPADPVITISKQLAASVTIGKPNDRPLPDSTSWGPVQELARQLGRSPDTLLYLLAAMLTERKLLLVASRLDRLTLCAFGCVSMLYPFSWEHVFAPSLSAANIDHIGCLVPCIFGLAEALYATNRARVDANFADPEFALVNLDSVDLFVAENSPASAEQIGLPGRVVRAAKHAIRRAQSSGAKGDDFSKALLKVNVELLAPIRLQSAAGASEFNLEAFLAASPESHRTFLRRLAGSQLFREFADRYLASPTEPHYDAFNRAADRLLNSRRRRRMIVDLRRNIGQTVRSRLARRFANQPQQQQQQLQRMPISDEDNDDIEDDEEENDEADGQMSRIVENCSGGQEPAVIVEEGPDCSEAVLISINSGDDSNNDAASLHSTASSQSGNGSDFYSAPTSAAASIHFVTPPPKPALPFEFLICEQASNTSSMDHWAALIGSNEPEPPPASNTDSSADVGDLLQFTSPFRDQILVHYGQRPTRPASYPAASLTGHNNDWVKFA